MDIGRETKRLFALRYMSHADSDDLVEWAKLALEAGLDSKSLCILAGLSSPIYSTEAETYFQRSLKELNVELPPVEECLHWYCYYTAQDILDNRGTPSEGCRKIYNTVMFLLQQGSDNTLPPNFYRWLDIDEEVNPDTYEYLTDGNFEDLVRREDKLLLANLQEAMN